MTGFRYEYRKRHKTFKDMDGWERFVFILKWIGRLFLFFLWITISTAGSNTGSKKKHR